MTQRPWECACALLLLGVGCARPAAPPAATRLVDVFDAKRVEGSVPATRLPPRSEWRFDGKAPHEFVAGPGVSGLAVRDGALSGKTTTDTAILHVERKTGLDNPDQLFAVEVRARVTGAANLFVATRSTPSVNLVAEVAEAATTPWTLRTPLLPGERTQTYTIPVPYAQTGRRIRHVLLRPSDAKGASFAIESLRLVFRNEHLASVPSGVSWQGLKDVFHETLVTRTPELARFGLRLPNRALLELSLGTPEDGPVAFSVSVARGKGPAVPVLEHTITTPYRWERRRVDLSAYAGADVTLSLAARSDRPGSIAFWGSPNVRQRQAPGGGSAPRGVILIQADTLRSDHLDAYGYARQTAPTLKRMAAGGVRFKNALAQTAWTKASTTSVMTSLYPTTHGVHQIPDRIPAATQTLAESYRRAGYATLSLSSIRFTGRLTNLHQGFEELHESESLAVSGGPQATKTAREYVDRLTEWLGDHRDVPFFVYLHVFDPHSPYEPFPPWNALWADPARRDEHVKQQETLKKFIANAFLARQGMATREEVVKAGLDPDAFIRQCQDWYDGSIRGMDAELSRLMERLRGLGLDRSTLVALYADHGEEFFDHGRMWHGQSVYGEMIRVPLLMWGAGIGSGRVREETVQLIDVMPTLLEISGLPVPGNVQGRSLRPLVSDVAAGAWTPRPAIAEKHPLGEAAHPGASLSYAIADGDWKLIHNVARPAERPAFELFEFRRDPLDQKDLAPQNPEVVARLGRTLEGWKKAATSAKLKPDSEATQGMNAEQLEKLRALGYIQ